MILGIDFDNTIIDYSKTFKHVALKDNLIKKNFPSDKQLIKKLLLEKNFEKKWTQLQGKVYGEEISKAKIYKNCKKILKELNKKKINKFIVSHRTLYPYIGKKTNLHLSAKNWLKKNNFYDSEINFNHNEIFFEKTKNRKIKKILSLKCTHFIDDLIEILHSLPDNIIKIHFNVLNKKPIHRLKKNFYVINNWIEMRNILM